MDVRSESPGAESGPERYAVLGAPAGHSLSPPLQRAAFAAAGIRATYEAIDVAPEALTAALARLHGLGYAGLNLTAPHKERACELLETSTPEVARLGSVNTLKRTAAGWSGHATDGLGFDAWTRETDLPFEGAHVALLGTGGAARAIAPYVAARGIASLTVVGRERARAEAILSVAGASGADAAWRAETWRGRGAPPRVGILIRALAEAGEVEGEPRWWDALAASGLAIDLNYGTRAERTRRRAEGASLRFEDGRGLLLHQGALAFSFWTGREAPLGDMRRALETAIG